MRRACRLQRHYALRECDDHVGRLGQLPLQHQQLLTNLLSAHCGGRAAAPAASSAATRASSAALRAPVASSCSMA